MSAILERFDGDDAPKSGGASPADVRLQQEKAAAYAEGYAAGQAAAQSKLAKENDFLKGVSQSIDGALSDLPNRISAQLCTAVSSVIQKIFPMLVEKGFADEVAMTVASAAKAESASALVIKAAADQTELLSTAFEKINANRSFRIEADSGLSDYQVKAQWDETEIEFDFNSALSAAAASLDKAAEELRGNGS